jgi:hypothetical protein
MATIAQPEHVTLEAARRQMVQFGNEIQEYLTRLEANVEGYKFSVEKRGEGLEVEVEFKALIHAKTRANIPK